MNVLYYQKKTVVVKENAAKVDLLQWVDIDGNHQGFAPGLFAEAENAVLEVWQSTPHLSVGLAQLVPAR